MQATKYVEQNLSIQCHGRDTFGKEVLKSPVTLNVNVHKSPGSTYISNIVECPYNTGGHGQRCKASHPYVDKIGGGVGCPYAFDIDDGNEEDVTRLAPEARGLLMQFIKLAQ